MGENYFGITDKGRQRSNNEDRFIAKAIFNDHFIAAAVIDGVGGYEGGEVAAQLTADTITKGLNKLPVDIIGKLAATLDTANERIIKEKKLNPQNDKMACVVTLALVDIEKNVFYFAHVGDTRLYLFRDGSLIKITKDHSTVGFLEESGRLTEEAAMAHPRRNEVNKALGFEAQIGQKNDFVDTGESPFLPGDTLLLCSDGLTDMIAADKIISILSTDAGLSQKGGQLVGAANEAGGRDNITVVLVRNHKSPVQHAVTKPIAIVRKQDNNGEGYTKKAGSGITNKTEEQKKEHSNPVNRWLMFLCSILFLGFIWLLFKQPGKKEETKINIAVDTVKPVNNRENIFLDSIHAASARPVRLIGSQPFMVSDTISINNDSLHIMGDGISFIRDSAYNGPAFALGQSCKYILLDSMTLENFDVGILVNNKGLHLKNVHFKNCKVPLQFNQSVTENQAITGAQNETIFKYADTARKAEVAGHRAQH